MINYTDNFSENLKILRTYKNLSQDKLAEELGLSRSLIGMWESGQRKPSYETLELIADFFNVRLDDLSGRTVSNNLFSPQITDDIVEFAVIGDVAAGFDKIAIEDWSGDKIEVPTSYLKGRNKEDFFVLRIKGDSMYPEYRDGDKVLVLKQNTVDYSGQVAVAIYNDDMGTIKKVEYRPDCINLVPINPQYQPEEIKDTESLHILGIPKLLIREIKN